MSYSNNSKEYPSFPGTEKETVEQVVSRQRATNKQETMVKTTIMLGMFLYVLLYCSSLLQSLNMDKVPEKRYLSK